MIAAGCLVAVGSSSSLNRMSLALAMPVERHSCSLGGLAARRDRCQVLGWGRPHAREAELRKAAALAVSLVSALLGT
jgi:hypothetical protein